MRVGVQNAEFVVLNLVVYVGTTKLYRVKKLNERPQFEFAISGQTFEVETSGCYEGVLPNESRLLRDLISQKINTNAPLYDI